MTVAEWSTIANLATALGTLILAVATFSAVRSSNLMAKVAQQQLLIQLRPVLAPSRREGPGRERAAGRARRGVGPAPPPRAPHHPHPPAPGEEFQRQTRDLYIPVGDVG